MIAKTASRYPVATTRSAIVSRYLHEHLPARIGGRERIVVIGGESTPDRTRALSRFAPDTVVRPGYEPADGGVDLLVSTDVLSEGETEFGAFVGEQLRRRLLERAPSTTRRRGRIADAS